MMELDFAKIKKYNQAYQKWLKQIPQVADYDNCQCCCFAHLLSAQAEADGYSTYKVCALSSKREAKGVSAFLPRAEGEDFAKVNWDYHMAFGIEVPVYQDSSKTELLVADPVLFGPNLVTLKQWKKTLDCPDYAFIQARRGQPIQYSPRGYWLSADEPQDLDAHALGELETLQAQVQKQQALEQAVKTNPKLQKVLDENRLQRYKPLTSLLAHSLRKNSPAPSYSNQRD